MIRLSACRLLPGSVATAVIGVALVLSLATACNRSKPTVSNAAPAPSPAGPTEEDLRVAREAMSITDVVAQLRAGVPKGKVLEAVQHRHLASLSVPANELELAANGADHQLLAALKDPANLVTPLQEAAYMHLASEHASAGGTTRKLKPAAAAR